ncbi:tail fiber domain-containing protein [bacterium]|nr:tail fiber domain-containing protein [bacterium]
MSQSSITIDPNQSGVSYTAVVNSALSAIDTCHAGASAPNLEVLAGKFWLDTSGASPILKIYNSGWKNLFTVGASNVSMAINSATVSSLTSSTSALGIISGSSLSVTGAISGASLNVSAGSVTGGAASFSSVSSAGGISAASATIGGNLTLTAGKILANTIDNYSGTDITIQGNIAMGNNTITCGTITSSGTVTATGNITAFSDARLKTNVKTIDNALDKVQSLRGVYYDKDNQRNIGVIAQEVEEVAPELVFTHPNDLKSVAYGNMVALLVEAVKEQQQQIEKLTVEVKELKDAK